MKPTAEQLNRNTGLLEKPIVQGNWLAGELSGIIYEEVNPSGQWLDYLPLNEWQNAVYFDTMACVSFSALSSLETQYKKLTGQEINLSDRFTAKISGTTRRGNWFTNVADSLRKDGFLSEIEYPFPRNQRTPVFDWDNYYQDIPQLMKDVAKKNLDLYEIQSEFIVNPTPEEVMKHLKQAPLQIASPTCYPWNTEEIVKACGKNSNHATLLVGYKENEYWYIYDSYGEPFLKRVAWDYGITTYHKLLLTIKKPMSDFIKKAEGKIIQDSEGSGSFGLVKNGKVLVATPERLSALLATYFVKKDGIPCPKSIWDTLPKENF